MESSGKPWELLADSWRSEEPADQLVSKLQWWAQDLQREAMGLPPGSAERSRYMDNATAIGETLQKPPLRTT
jgi:hypothetical protein